MAEPTVLPCSECGLPFAKLENGCLIIESRHHGQKHVNVVSLEFLQNIQDIIAHPPPELGPHTPKAAWRVKL